ncbi:unnamed protein product [Musa acuminata subsp. burmannicoides]
MMSLCPHQLHFTAFKAFQPMGAYMSVPTAESLHDAAAVGSIGGLTSSTRLSSMVGWCGSFMSLSLSLSSSDPLICTCSCVGAATSLTFVRILGTIPSLPWRRTACSHRCMDMGHG